MRPRQPISSPDIRSLSAPSDDLPTITALNNPVTDNKEQALLPPAMPPTFIYTPSSRVSTILVKFPENVTRSEPIITSRVLHPPSPPVRQRKYRGLRIVFIALILVVVASAGFIALYV